LSAERNIRARLTWSRIYRATSYARSALWIVPLVAVVLVMMAGPAIRAVDRALGWSLLGLSAHGAEAPYHRVTEIHFPSMEALQASAANPSSLESAAHAVAISSGGPPVFLITDEGEVVA